VKIESIEVHNLHYRYPDDEVHRCAEGHMGDRTTSLVFVRCSGGLTGVGSAYSHPAIVRLVVEQHLAPFLVGRDATHVEELWDLMYSLTRWYGRKGAAVSALGAIDIALWDIRGKLEQAPVYQLLGGHAGDVTAYASGLLWQDEMSVLEREARRHLDDGFLLMKMRLGRDADYDRRAVSAVTGVIGDRARLAVDGTHRYTEDEAARFAEFLHEAAVAWFEEPFPPEAVEAYARLRSRVKVPISAGENEFGVQGFAELFRLGAVDIAQPDVSRAGGITECRRIGELAHGHSLQVVTHTWSDAVALTANAHLVAALPNGMAVEVDRTGCPFIDGLLTEPIAVKDGSIHLSDRPGLGVEVDPAIVERYEVRAGQRLPDGNYADMVFGGGDYSVVPPRIIR